MSLQRITVSVPMSGNQHARDIDVTTDIRTKYPELAAQLEARVPGCTEVEENNRYSFYLEFGKSFRWEEIQEAVVAVIKEVFEYGNPELINND